MKNAANFGADDRKAGLSTSDIWVILKILERYMYDFRKDIYEGRTGTVVMDAQPTIAANPKRIVRDQDGKCLPTVRSIAYGQPKCLLRFDYEDGDAKTIFFDSMKVADEAINSLLEGKRFFFGHKNAVLNGGIYKTSGSSTYESGHLMILNAYYGRFLVGCGDAKADSVDSIREHDFILIAIARILAHMFPHDEEIQASFDWIRRTSNLTYYHCDIVVAKIDQIFKESPRYIREYYWKREFEAGNTEAAILAMPFV